MSTAEEYGGKGRLTFGQRAADALSDVGGSWVFVGLFVVFVASWVVVSALVVFDPYPYILLNLILSCVAALQAPIILMSQNRKTELEREAARLDREVNSRTETELLRVAKLLAQHASGVEERLEAIERRLGEANSIE